jgi:hypothetical protein
MSDSPVVAPIVEGHGEVAAVRGLVSRIGLELLAGTWIEVAQPFRLDSGKMRKPDELARALRTHRSSGGRTKQPIIPPPDPCR